MGLFRRKSSDTIDTPSVAEAKPPGRAAGKAGAPGRCPECDGFGYIDQIDMVNRTQTQHCRLCRHTWEFSFDEDGDVIDLTAPGAPGPTAGDQTTSDRGSVPR